ncbi:MAG TPA: sigma-70 family RNA polymerase sigma factor [Longimicrobiales bacterium]|nr:sigma-70 family RNA polymerase sigma factor [Longimicrobiales bacterium]
MDRIRATMMKAWAHLNGSAVRQRSDPPRAGRPRDPGVTVQPAETRPLGKPGFAEEALPWMDAVHRFALRLTRGGAEAEDLVQETYLRAFRSWDQFERGTNCRSWLFTICRNTHLHERERASSRYEITETDAGGADNATRSLVDQRALAAQSPDDFFEQIVDERLLEAVDALPEEFRETSIHLIVHLRSRRAGPVNLWSWSRTGELPQRFLHTGGRRRALPARGRGIAGLVLTGVDKYRESSPWIRSRPGCTL